MVPPLQLTLLEAKSVRDPEIEGQRHSVDLVRMLEGRLRLLLAPRLHGVEA